MLFLLLQHREDSCRSQVTGTAGAYRALSRAIVVHGAWYVNEEMIGHSGMLGRSQGCFAIADSSLPEIIARLGPGRLIYADKLPA
jgi:hypothetical protein